MSKGLEALERIEKEGGTPYFTALYDIDMWNEDISIVEKELKALEIIKNKKVNVFLLNNANLMNYNFLSIDKERFLSEKEFKLLKEVLSDDN